MPTRSIMARVNQMLTLSAENALRGAHYVAPHMTDILDSLIKSAKGYSYERAWTDRNGHAQTSVVNVAPDVKAAELVLGLGLYDTERVADFMVSVRRAEMIVEQTKVLPIQGEKMIAETSFTRRTTLAFDRELVDNEDVIDSWFKLQGSILGWMQAVDVGNFPTDEPTKEAFIIRFTEALERARQSAMSDLPGQTGFITMEAE